LIFSVELKKAFYASFSLNLANIFCENLTVFHESMELARP
jgi:hypothetical protein